MNLFVRAAGIERELAQLPEPAERERLIQAVMADREVRRVAIREFAAIYGFTALVWLVLTAADPIAPCLASFPLGVLILYSIIFFPLVHAYRNRELYRRTVRRHITHGVTRLCRECGYDLRATTEPRCPECGTAFERAKFSLLEPSCAHERPTASRKKDCT